MRKRAFTLIELIIVIIIIGILATLGFVSYTGVMEKAREAEAIIKLRAWVNEMEMCYLERNTVVGCPSPRPYPVACSSEYYFRWYESGLANCGENMFGFKGVFSRCLTNGKPPQGSSPRYVTVYKHFGGDNKIEIRVTDTYPTQLPDCP